MNNRRSGFGIALKGVIWHDEKFLILKRVKSSPNEPDLWEFPGGGLELGEKHEEALVREILEETTLNASIVKPLSIWDAKRKDGTQVIGITFLCKLHGGQVNLSEEHTDFAWVAPKDIDLYPVFPQMKREVKSWELSAKE